MANQLTRYSEQSSSGRLAAKLTKARSLDDIRDNGQEFPVLVGRGRELVEAEVASMMQALVPAGSAHIGKALAPLTFMPRRKGTDAEADMQLAVYEMALDDIPADILNLAIKDCVKTLRFFPMPAEIRERAEREIGRRQWRITCLREWLRKKEPAQVDYITAEEFAQFKQQLANIAGKEIDA